MLSIHMHWRAVSKYLKYLYVQVASVWLGLQRDLLSLYKRLVMDRLYPNPIGTCIGECLAST